MAFSSIYRRTRLKRMGRSQRNFSSDDFILNGLHAISVWSMNSIDAVFSGCKSDDPMTSYEQEIMSGSMAMQGNQGTVSAVAHIAPARHKPQHDALSLIPFNDYNPSNFDIRPPFVSILPAQRLFCC